MGDEYPGLIGSFGKPLSDGDGTYKATGVTLKVAGWLNLIVFWLSLLAGITLVLLAFFAGPLAADIISSWWDGCDAECQDTVETASVIAGVLVLVFFLIVWTIQYLIVRWLARGARLWATQERGALGTVMALGIVLTLLGLFELLGSFNLAIDGAIFGAAINIGLGVFWIVATSLPTVRAHFPEGAAAAEAAE